MLPELASSPLTFFYFTGSVFTTQYLAVSIFSLNSHFLGLLILGFGQVSEILRFQDGITAFLNFRYEGYINFNSLDIFVCFEFRADSFVLKCNDVLMQNCLRIECFQSVILSLYFFCSLVSSAVSNQPLKLSFLFFRYLHGRCHFKISLEP